MDTIDSSSRQQITRTSPEEAQTALRHAALNASFKNDPLSVHLNALALAVGALGELYLASEATQIDIAETLKSQTDIVTREAIAKVHASGVSLVQGLGPQLASAAEWTMRQRFKIIRLRTIFALSAGLVAIVLIPCAFTYAAGLNVGRTQGEVAAHTIQKRMTNEPLDAPTWAMLMQYNDAVRAMSECRKNISKGAEGRRYCQMPVWIDPPPVANRQ